MFGRFVCIVCLLVVTSSVGMAVPVADTGGHPVRTYEGDSDVAGVVVDSHSVQFDGSTVYEVTVVANSSKLVDVNAQVVVALETVGGRVVSDGRNTKLLAAGGSTTYAIDVSPNATRTDFATVNVTVDN